MELFLFQRENYLQRYNCSVKSDAAWEQIREPNVTLGTLCIAMGAIYAGLYIFCMVVMAKPELRQNSCYKIMMYLGVVDLIALLFNCLTSGILFLEGAVFCTHPNIIYFAGCVANGLWANQCFTCVLLAFNRVLDICDRHWIKCLFAGRRTYFWLAAPLCYNFIFGFFTSPMLFSSKSGMWMLNAFYKLDIPFEVDLMTKIIRVVNNTTMVVSLLVLYTILSVKLWKSKPKIGVQNRDCHISRFQKQAVLICAVNVVTAFTEIAQFVEAPINVTVACLFIWQASNGAVSFIYLALNRTIRRGVHHMVTNKPRIKGVFQQRMFSGNLSSISAANNPYAL
uniref:G_PROTEIN_RECEP_F1_2 domain-containing protein n=1 Tax=Steinernema glaseri TaxID=37863 RepID=A0A1I7YT39_9BILA